MMNRFSAEDSIHAEAASLSIYLREISGNRILSMEEERALFGRMSMGDAAAVHELIAANLKIVVSICREFANRGLPLTDIICEGNLALARAARTFDATHGCRFAAYATWWIRRRVMRALAKQTRYLAATPPTVSGTIMGKAGEWSGALRRETRAALEQLGEVERNVVRMHFGLGLAHAMNLEGIAMLLGLSGAKVRKIRDDAVDRMRHSAARIRYRETG